MEDIIPETEKLVHEEELMEESESENNEERSNGSMKNFLPKLICEKEVENNNNNNGDEIKGGIITHIISNLVSPMSPKAVDFWSSKNGDSISSNGESEEDLAKNGGVMNNLISNLFHHSEEHQEKKEDDEQQEEEENSKRGLIDNIVSHFPTSIPDHAVPTTDEASILIHSIVKD